MAILHRRGLVEDFDQTKMLPGEIAISTDEPILWFCWQAGKVIKLGKIDNALSELSTNAIQNSVVTAIIHQLSEHIDENTEEIAEAKAALNSKFDGAYADEDGYLYLTSNGEVVEGPIGPFAGGSGGGSGSNNATLTVANTTGWLSKTISESEECEVSFSWTSVEGDFATGDGTANIKVNGSSKAVKNIAQGNVTLQLKEYLVIGANIVRIAISDIYGNTKTLSFSIERIAFSLTSPFDDTVVYENDITFPYIPTGAAAKVMQFVLDGTLIGSEEVTTTGRQQSFVIPMQSHGSHTFEVYFTAQINESVVESNHLYYDIMFKEAGCSTKIIASSFNIKNVQQYYPVVIPWIAYSPDALSTDVQLCVNGEVVQELTVDRTKQTWTYRADAVGKMVLEIVAGDVKKPFELNVLATDINVSAEENDLGLYLTSYGRSNNEAEPGVWNYGGISAEFNNFNFVSNGWMSDNEGNTVLRVNGDARLTIPYKIFASDFRTTGKTIEFEIATRDVLNYDAVMLSCMSGGRGIEITTQMAAFTSEQSAISTKYKEEEHIRISFVVEKKSSNKLLYCYINGVLTRCCLYSDDDDFSQALPVDITFGSNDCTTDIYNVRVYDNDLTRYQMLDNWIADTQSGAEKKNRYDRNNIYDDYGNITIETLKKDVPYLVLICPVLPTFKGDKKTCSGYYIDPVHPERSFWFEDAQIDVQGTSSQYYRIKNIKAKFKNGFILEDGTLILEYQLNGAGVPTSTFTFKADVASSEGFLNVILAQLYNDLCPVKTPAQQDNPDVRQAIDGTPIVIFHDNGSGPVFYGKFNFNHDKGTPEVFGFEEGDESWEILQNGTDRVGFRSADFSGDDWKNDFEARYPEDNTDTTRLAAFAAWIASTNTAAATDEELTEAVTYGDVTYTHDTAEYRLEKFKNELPDHASVEALVFYYLFTLIFLCIDQREKNAFPTWISRLALWIVLFYDADSSMGTDNKGNLAFDYWMEDIDFTDAGEPVFNGQNSVLWKNMRTCFWDEISAEYVRLRTTLGADGNPLLSYEVVINKIKAHVGTWCEAIYNEDAYKKYIEAFVVDGDASYLPMLRGNKMEFIMWWLYNRFRYMDSLFATGTSMEKRIMIRAHAKANVTMTAYVNMYGRVYYNALMAMNRMMRGQAYEFIWDATGAEDAVIGINDADMITDIGDLAPLLPETIDISKAIHLERLKFGDEAIVNSNMTTVTLGNNVLLRLLDGGNCPNLTGVVDASGCTGLVEVYLEGTSITNLKLPNGGQTEIVHLPETITNLTLMNLTKLKELVAPSFANVSTLRLENVGNIVDTFEILESIASGSRVRLIGVEWSFDTAEEIAGLNNIIASMRGLDENGNNVDTPQISGTCHINTLTGAELNQLKALYPYLTITYDTLSSVLTFMSETGTEVLGTQTIQNGGNGEYTGDMITKESTAQYDFTHNGWSLKAGGEADVNALLNVEGDRTVYAAFSKTVRNYTVNFYVEGVLKETYETPYSGTATYAGETPVSQYDYLEFTCWSPSPVGITGNTDCHAQWYDTREISDDWETIAANCLNGTATDKYAIGSYKPVEITYEDGTSETIDFEVIAHNHDELADGINKWEQLDKLPAACQLAGSAVTYNNEIHALCYGGHYKYDGTSWTRVGDSPYAFQYSNMVVYNEEIHILGANSGDYTHAHYKFDGTTWTEVGTLPYHGGCAKGCVYNGLLYVFLNEGVYTYDGTTWEETDGFLTSYTKFSINCTIYNNEIHVIYGSLSGHLNGIRPRHFKYDGETWTELDAAPVRGKMYEMSGDLYVISEYSVYKYNGTEWSYVDSTYGNFDGYAYSERAVIYNQELHCLNNTKHWKWSIASTEVLNGNEYKIHGTTMMVLNDELYSIGGIYTNMGIYKHDSDGNSTRVCVNEKTLAHYKYVIYNNAIHILGIASYEYAGHLVFDGETITELSTLPFQPRAAFVYDGKIHAVGNGVLYIWSDADDIWIEQDIVAPTLVINLTYSSTYDGQIHIYDSSYKNHYLFNGEEFVNCDDPYYSYINDTKVFITPVIYHDEMYGVQGLNLYKYENDQWRMIQKIKDDMNDSIILYRERLYVFKQSYIYEYKNPRATLTFLAKNVLKDKRQFHSSDNACWSVSNLRKFCNGDLYNSLPEDLQSAISEVIKFYDTGSIGQSLEYVNDKVWICSMEEYGFELDDIVHGQGSSYPVFTNNNSRKRTDTEGTAVDYWSRTYNLNNGKVYVVYGTDGVKGDNTSTNPSVRVLPGFCI